MGSPAAQLFRIVTNFNLPGLFWARYVVEQHWRQSFRHIHLFRRTRRRDRGGLACISGTVEEPFPLPPICKNPIEDAPFSSHLLTSTIPYGTYETPGRNSVAHGFEGAPDFI